MTNSPASCVRTLGAECRIQSSLPPQWKGQGGRSPGVEEWELDQCKFCGQNKISVGVIFLKCIVRFLSSIQAYPTALRHSLKVLKSVTAPVSQGCPSGQHKSTEEAEKRCQQNTSTYFSNIIKREILQPITPPPSKKKKMGNSYRVNFISTLKEKTCSFMVRI